MNIWKFKDRSLDLDKGPYVMGILNVTPDSFSDGGKFNNVDSALFHAEQMIKDGAKIIDVGGESTRPGFTQISDEEEISRITPVITKIAEQFDVVISVDTYKSAVAEAALIAGAHIVNDIHGFRYDPKIAAVTAKYGAGAVLMANFSDKPEGVNALFYEKKCFDTSLSLMKDNGIDIDYVLLDPGIGFGTTREEDIALIRSMEISNRMLLGASRKRIVAALLSRETVAAERIAGSVGIALAGVSLGAKVVRVHDVKETVDALNVYTGILNF